MAVHPDKADQRRFGCRPPADVCPAECMAFDRDQIRSIAISSPLEPITLAPNIPKRDHCCCYWYFVHHPRERIAKSVVLRREYSLPFGGRFGLFGQIEVSCGATH